MHIRELGKARSQMQRDMKEFEELAGEFQLLAGKAWKNYEEEDYETFRSVADEVYETYTDAANRLDGYRVATTEMSDFIENGRGSKEPYRDVLNEYAVKQERLNEIQQEKRAITSLVHHLDSNEQDADQYIGDTWEDAYDTVKVARRKAQETRSVVDAVAERNELAETERDGLASMVEDVTAVVDTVSDYDHDEMLYQLNHLNSAVEADYREIHDDMVDQYQKITDKAESLLPDGEQPQTVEYDTRLN